MYDIKKELQAVHVFKDAKASTLKLLEPAVKVRTVKKGAHLFSDKDDVQVIYGIISGRAALYKMNTLGEKKVIFIYKGGYLLNEVILQEMRASISCEVLEDSQILVIPREALLNAMEKDFELTKRILESMGLKIRRLYRQLKNSTNSMRGEKKIASKLWKLGRDYGVQTDKGIYIDMELSITYLADMLGSKRETVSRQLKILTEEKLIQIDKNRFFILDNDKLKNFFERP